MAVNGTTEASGRSAGADRPAGAGGAAGTGGSGAAAEETPSGGRPPRSLYLGVFGLLLGMFLAMVDGLIVGTALPTIVGSSAGWTSCRGW